MRRAGSGEKQRHTFAAIKVCLEVSRNQVALFVETIVGVGLDLVDPKTEFVLDLLQYYHPHCRLSFLFLHWVKDTSTTTTAVAAVQPLNGLVNGFTAGRYLANT